MEKWTGVGAHHAFAVKVYYKNGDGVMCAQHLYQCHFHMNRSNPVPSTHAIKTWMKN